VNIAFGGHRYCLWVPRSRGGGGGGGPPPHVAWLTAPADVLWARARAAAQGDRPLAKDEQAFGRLLEERNDLYRRVASAAVLNDGSRALAAVADEVAALAADGGPRPAPGHGEDRR
jgi:hypothetical protein